MPAEVVHQGEKNVGQGRRGLEYNTTVRSVIMDLSVSQDGAMQLPVRIAWWHLLVDELIEHNNTINTMTHAFRQYLCFAIVLCLACTTRLRAETSADDASPGGSSRGTDVLEEVVVKGVKLEDQVSPLQRRVSSVLGLELS
ncbi:MAG: hypothetical protein JWO52_2615, partial [Gammaproteobacteria bacterium]|nr:hypothetical protein [Gammaproteobacteria bacterium]